MNRSMSLRVSLLMAMGIVPFACSGDDDVGDDPSGSAGEAGGPDKFAKGGEGGSGLTAVGGAGGTGLTATAGQGGGQPISCTTPQRDLATGLVRCAEGYLHRSQAVACGAEASGQGGASGEGGAAARPPRADGSVSCSPLEQGQGGAGGDTAQPPCGEFHLGFCDMDGTVDLGGGSGSGHCASGCITDQDCAPDFICVCGDERSPSGGVCRVSDCATDADCADGLLCASYDYKPDGCGFSGIAGFACQTTDDECASDSDCPTGEHCLAAQQQSSDGAQRVCDGVAVCGRPFLVEACPRLAPLVLGDAWNESTSQAPALEQLTANERAAQAEHWARLGQMEHASIAAFARFSLQLLSLGAPADLVEDCARALADETAHARLCFQLASAYAGSAVGPGPLDVAGCLSAANLLDVVELVIVEGCLGETVAALDAAEAAAAAADPVIVAAYARIAEDEQRHAALAFRFVRWALLQDRAGTERCIRRALAELPGSVGARGVVAPCLRAIVGEDGSGVARRPSHSDYRA